MNFGIDIVTKKKKFSKAFFADFSKCFGRKLNFETPYGLLLLYTVSMLCQNQRKSDR